MTNRRDVLLSGGALLLLAGCGDLIKAPPSLQLYALQPEMPAPAPGAKVSWSLALQLPDAVGNLDSNRLTLIRGSAMDYYANAQLPEHLSPLVQTALLDAFERSGRIDQVSRSEDGIRSDYLLQTDIRNCEAQYDSPDGAPKINVRIAAKLVNTFDRRIVANLLAEQQVQAAEDSVPAVVNALDQALGAAIAMIVNWTLAAQAPIAGNGRP